MSNLKLKHNKSRQETKNKIQKLKDPSKILKYLKSKNEKK